MSKQPPPAPTATAVGPCPTIIQIVGRPGTGRLPRTIAPLDYLHPPWGLEERVHNMYLLTSSLSEDIPTHRSHAVESTLNQCWVIVISKLCDCWVIIILISSCAHTYLGFCKYGSSWRGFGSWNVIKLVGFFCSGFSVLLFLWVLMFVGVIGWCDGPG